MSAQPDWEVVYETDYSTLFRDKTGKYPAELMIREEIDDTEWVNQQGEDTVEVEYYRFPLDRLKLVPDDEDPLKSYLVPEAYEESWPYPASRYEEWFVEDLPGVASSVGCEHGELVEALCGEDIRARAWAYEAIGGYHGFMNLDGYPERKREEV